MRSTAQAFSGLIAQVLGAIFVGSIGGFLAAVYSVPVMLRIGAGIIATGGFAFFILFGLAMKYHNKRYGPNMEPYIDDETTKKILSEHPKAERFRAIRSKDGVHVFYCLLNGIPAVVKYFENQEDKREIANYQMLSRLGIPTLKVLAYGESSIMLEDVTVSEDWRLGTEADMDDIEVAAGLAHWYSALHEKGAETPELGSLYFEYDEITEEKLRAFGQKYPQASQLCEYYLSRYELLREMILRQRFTLTYNDFYYTNFVVRTDKSAAMMYDYNLLGKGYRSSDFINVFSALSETAKDAFTDAYGREAVEGESEEKSLSDAISRLHAMIVLDYAEEDGYLAEMLEKARKLFP
jgi:hypothetical protein